MESRPTLAIISQVYVPDPAAVGQYMADAAAEIARRGMRVVVLTSRRGYEDPGRKYPRRESLGCVEVRRLPASSFGKATIARRVLGAVSFLGQAVVHALCMRRLDGLLVGTSPPMGALAALAIAAVRRTPIIYWVMDINPDQAVALGVVRPRSLGVRCLETLNLAILRKARCIVTLDPFMAARLCDKANCDGRLAVIPPWPHEDVIEPVPHEANPFRREQGWDGRIVVMYSGNMSPAHPLDTILQAAARLRGHPELTFAFLGGGLGKSRVERFVERETLGNVRVLPYQPLERLRYSLSAADIHLVSMGDNMVGIVHPSKVHAAMACARPVLLIGPCNSYAGRLIQRHGMGWQVDHGDVDRAVAVLLRIATMDRRQLDEMGARGRRAIDAELGRQSLRGRFCDAVEAAIP